MNEPMNTATIATTTIEQVENETERLLQKVEQLGWTKPFVETSCVTGPFPWRVTLGGHDRRPQLIQGVDINDAFAKSWRWLAAGAVARPYEVAAHD